MIIRATRNFSQATFRVAFYIGLFVLVVVAQVGVSSGLRVIGWSPGMALVVSGAVVLASVLLAMHAYEVAMRRRALALERDRIKYNYPEGGCCVLWSNDLVGSGPRLEEFWTPEKKLAAPFPKSAWTLGVEGYAILEFEMSAEGRAKNIHCVDAWPSEAFYEAARRAITETQFRIQDGAQVRFGVSYKMPFVFRIADDARMEYELQRKLRRLKPLERLRATRFPEGMRRDDSAKQNRHVA